MSSQIEPASLGEPGVLTAAEVLRWRCRQANVALPRLPEAAIITHQGSLMPRRHPWSRDRSHACFSFEVRLLASTRGLVALALCRGVGAPGTAVAIEEMAVAGVRRVLSIDICGSLDDSVPGGSILLAEAALAGDGTSPHYALAPVVRPSETLTSTLSSALSAHDLPHKQGLVWSTDAVYRETPSQVRGARERGAVAADMETACVFAVSQAVGIEAGAALVTADELFDGWRPPADMAPLQAQLKRLLALAPDCLLP